MVDMRKDLKLFIVTGSEDGKSESDISALPALYSIGSVKFRDRQTVGCFIHCLMQNSVLEVNQLR